MRYVLFALLLKGIPYLSAASEGEVDKLQKSWDATRAYEAEFVQIIKSKVMGGDEDPTEGTLSVVKPDRLRWEDKTTGVIQILNKGRYWEITKDARRKTRSVVHHPDVSKSLANSSMQVLAGTGKFKGFYKVKLLSQNDQEARLELKPKKDTNETLIAKIDKNGYVLRSLTTDSQDSQVVVEFKNIRRNPILSDKLFTYAKEPGDVFQTRKD